jgi:hypothetical protein
MWLGWRLRGLQDYKKKELVRVDRTLGILQNIRT